jgi:hypothetical protein
MGKWTFISGGKSTGANLAIHLHLLFRFRICGVFSDLFSNGISFQVTVLMTDELKQVCSRSIGEGKLKYLEEKHVSVPFYQL